MLPTFATYQLYTRNADRMMDRIKADPVNRRETEYYRENIGKVHSVDDFMGDYLLYSHAMTAFGLADQIDSRGLIRKVLESDLSDPKSFANKLGDEKYRDFAAAFSFDKKVDANTIAAQSNSQLDRTLDAYSQHRVGTANALKRQLDDYRDKVGKIANVDEFMNTPSLFETALSAVGIDPGISSTDFIRDVLVGNAADGPASRGDMRFLKLKAMLHFTPDGKVGPGGLQSELEANQTIHDFFASKDLAASPASGMNDVAYWKAKIASVTTADQFTQDPRLLDVALTSVGLQANIQLPSFVWQVLTSDPKDPESRLNKMPEETEQQRDIKAKYTVLREAFQFDAAGKLAPGASAPQTPDAQEAMLDKFLSANLDRNALADKTATAIYQISITNVKTVSQFINSDGVYTYALKAFGIDPQSVSRSDIIKVLRSDPGDPKSFAVESGDERFVALAAAFNFDDSGNIAQKRTAQTNKAFADLSKRFSDSYGEAPDGTEKREIQTETKTYQQAIANVVSVNDLVSNKQMVAYITKAFDLSDLHLDKEKLTAILTSDLADPTSAVNVSGDKRLKELRAAFEFNSFGGVNRTDPSVQSKADRLKVDDYFLRQKLEESAGAENEGVRLALYFKRMAPNLKHGYDIMADPALLKVAQTAIGLPATAGRANVDVQNRTLESRIDIKSLKDPEALSRFISRFLSMYDMENNASAASNPALMVLSGAGGGGGGGLLGML